VGTSTKDKLEAIRALLVNDGWTQGASARDSKGRVRNVHTVGTRMSHDILGAMAHLGTLGGVSDVPMNAVLHHKCRQKCIEAGLDETKVSLGITAYNDRVAQKPDDVIALLDECIAECEQATIEQ